MAEDYYSLLGVAKNASEADIKSAYRKLAMKHHPDRNPGNKDSEQKFRRINAAYETLSDPKKRQLYDRFGEAGVSGAGAGAGGHNPFGGAGVDLGDLFGDAFENFFGGQQGRGSGRRAGHGNDLKYDIEITLSDAYHGAEVPVSFERAEACGACRGSGAKPGTSLKRCPHCGGRGRVQFSQGFFSMTQACPQCRGEGQIIEAPCKDCRGLGRVRRHARLTAKVPPGIYDGATLRISGEGEAGTRGAPAGDLYIGVRVKADPRFERDEDDLIVERIVDIAHAALGTTLEVATLGGERTTIKIPEGVQAGATFRIHDKGMPKLHGKGHGDLLIKIKIQVPKDLTPRQKELLGELAKTFHENGQASHQAPAEEDPGGLFKKFFHKEK